MADVPIFENYGTYEPDFDVPRTVRKLLASVPSQYLVGLGTIELAAAPALNRQQRRQRTRGNYRVGADEVRGLYWARHRDRRASITLFVDRLGPARPRWVYRIPPFRDFLVADVLFHEIGHHIHATSRPEYKEQEDVAEKWGKRLLLQYLRRRYWYLTPFVVVTRPIIVPILKGVHWLVRRRQSE